MISPEPFSLAYRDRVFSQILKWASVDSRIVAGAVVGSVATSPGDRWSDLDLSFAVGGGLPAIDVLEDWTANLATEFSTNKLFDVPVGRSIYRVFLLPGCLQLDLSFTPAEDFGAIGPNFRLLFGEAVKKPHVPLPKPEDLFGYAVHHAAQGPHLHRARAVAASRVLDQLRPSLRSQPRLPAARPISLIWTGLRPAAV